MLNQPASHPIIIGIVGDSAAGKTTLSAGVAEIFGRENVTLICTDDYHKYDRRRRAQTGISALDPKGNYIDILEGHLRTLRKWRPILKPVYNHETGCLDPPEYIEPKPYIVVEGLLGYATRALRLSYDVKLYLDPEEGLRRRWKVIRDTQKRGYTEEEVLAALRKREPISEAFIRPQRKFADMVIKFYPPEDDATETGAHLNVQQVLRPTLPHPDLTPLLGPESNGNSGLHMKLARGPDNKPVDVLEIDGNIPDARAMGLEDLLWNLIPEASRLQENVGKFYAGPNGSDKSHPLSLTQLLIAYHIVMAEQGVHAV